MLALLLPGSAITYNGEEIGMEDGFVSWNETKDPAGINGGEDRYLIISRDAERTPFQWDNSTSAGKNIYTYFLYSIHPFHSLNLLMAPFRNSLVMPFFPCVHLHLLSYD